MHLHRLLVTPGKRVRLDRMRADNTRGLAGKAEAERRLDEDVRELEQLQERLYVQGQNAVLVILQARDAAGKDSTIKHVLTGVNPQGVEVTSFKAPSARELDHDYLWRSVVALPERGSIGIHNRSYYEEVLVARVHPDVLARERLPRGARHGDLWARRYEEINRFERFLVENGTVIVKLFLHVSREEQRRRFLDRIDTPRKQWKFSLQDVKEREEWPAYDAAYSDMLTHTSTDIAPWYVVPADHKWYLHAAVAAILVKTMRDLKIAPPKLDKARAQELEEGRRLLEAEGRKT